MCVRLLEQGLTPNQERTKSNEQIPDILHRWPRDRGWLGAGNS
jgi:hypothetical protein